MELAEIRAGLEHASRVDGRERVALLAQVHTDLGVMLADCAIETHGEERTDRSAVDVITGVSKMARPVAVRLVSDRRFTHQHDAVAEAVAGSEVSADQVGRLHRLLPKGATAYRQAMFERDKKYLVDTARDTDYAEFKKKCDQWEQICNEGDPDRPDVPLRVRVTDLHDGTASVSGRVPVETGLMFKKSLLDINDELHRDDTDTTVDGLPCADAHGRRMCAALRILIERATTRKRGKTPEPLLTVRMSWDTFNEETARQFLGDIPDPSVVFKPGYLSETLDGDPMTPRDALRVGLFHKIQRIVVDSENLRVNLGRAKRLFKGNARKAVQLRDAGCTQPGCDYPVRWTEIDHILDWQFDGQTDSDNGRCLCWKHHPRDPIP